MRNGSVCKHLVRDFLQLLSSSQPFQPGYLRLHRQTVTAQALDIHPPITEPLFYTCE